MEHLIFYPRKWINNKEKPGYMKCIPKKIGFDFIDLGWKTKWTDIDYRYEWSPIWSFVFFKWQICILFDVPHQSNYWESWLYYELNTNKTKSQKERIEQCKKEFDQIWTRYEDDDKIFTNYYDLILKK